MSRAVDPLDDLARDIARELERSIGWPVTWAQVSDALRAAGIETVIDAGSRKMLCPRP